MKPLKIAILTSDKRDHDRDYSRPLPEFGTAPEALLQGLAGLPEAEVHVVSCVQKPLASPEKMASNIFYHSLLVPKIGWLRTLYSGCIRATRRKLREIQPDLVHGQGTERDCAISAVLSGFPNVLTIHGNMRRIAALNKEKPFSYKWLAARLEGFVLPRTNGVVCITEHTRKEVQNLARQTWILPNPVDENFFNIEAVPRPTTLDIGLCVGSICPLKNQNSFIRALDPLAKIREFKFIFAGAVDSNDYGKEFLRLAGERPWCEHIGFIGRKELKARLANASMLALPTLEDNCPMVVLEAMAAGVPVMASGVGGVPDLIESERTGLLCNPNRPETFRECVERILADRQWAGQLAAAAKAEALQRFHPEVIARKHLEIYRQVLGKSV